MESSTSGKASGIKCDSGCGDIGNILVNTLGTWEHVLIVFPTACSQVLSVFPKMSPIPPPPPSHFIMQVLQLSSWEGGLEFGLCCFFFWGYTHKTHRTAMIIYYMIGTYLHTSVGYFCTLMGSWDKGIGQGNSLTVSNCHIQDPHMTFSI
jgi:hypothetical protein